MVQEGEGDAILGNAGDRLTIRDEAAGIECDSCGAEMMRFKRVCPACMEIVRKVVAEVENREDVIRKIAMGRIGSAAEIDKVWTDDCEKLLREFQSCAERLNLDFHSRIALKPFILRRVLDGCKCVMPLQQKCPCAEPLRWDCPLLHLRK